MLDPETGLYKEEKTDGTSSGSSAEASYKDGKATVGAGTSQATTNKDGSGSTSSSNQSVAVDTKSGALTVTSGTQSAANDKTGAGSGQSSSSSATIDVENGTYKESATSGQTTKNADGTSSGKSSTSTSGIENGKYVKEKESTKSTTNKEGTEHSTSTTAKGSIGKGGASGEIGTKAGHKNEGTGAHSSMGASVGGGYKVDGKVVKEGAQWAAYWCRLVEVSGKASGSGGNVQTAKSGNANVGAKFEIGDSGKQLFSSEAKATAWLEQAKLTMGATITGGGSAKGALAMEEGEEWAKGSAFGMSLGAGGTLGDLTVGATGSIKSSQGATVKRLDKKRFEVTRFHQSDANGTLSLGYTFVTISGSKGTSRRVQATLEFDLASAPGQQNFESYVDGGKLVNDAYKKGSEQIIDTATGETGLKFEALGASMSVTNKSTVTDTATTDADGKTTKATKGQNDKGYAVDLFGLYKESHTVPRTPSVGAAKRTASRRPRASVAMAAAKPINMS